MRAAILLLAVAACHAGTLTFGTGVGGPEGNSLTGTNVPTVPASVFHAPMGTSIWESTQLDSLNPPIPNGTQVTFWFTFDVPGLPLLGTLGVLVDDSARGWLNGQALFDNLGSPQGHNCAASQPNCLNPLWLDITPYLLPGANTLTTTVSQDGGGQFAIDAYGSVEYLDAQPTGPGGGEETPEPASMSLIGGGLVALGLVWKQRGGR